MTPTKQRAEQVLFTKPYIAHDPLVIVTLASTKTIHNLDDLKNKTVIVNDGHLAEQFMAQQKDIILQRLPTAAEAFLALKAGRGDAYISAKQAVQPFFKKYGNAIFNMIPIPQAPDNSSALAVSKKFPELLPLIQTELSTLADDGTIATLKHKWHIAA